MSLRINWENIHSFRMAMTRERTSILTRTALQYQRCFYLWNFIPEFVKQCYTCFYLRFNKINWVVWEGGGDEDVDTMTMMMLTMMTIVWSVGFGLLPLVTLTLAHPLLVDFYALVANTLAAVVVIFCCLSTSCCRWLHHPWKSDYRVVCNYKQLITLGSWGGAASSPSEVWGDDGDFVFIQGPCVVVLTGWAVFSSGRLILACCTGSCFRRATLGLDGPI